MFGRSAPAQLVDDATESAIASRLAGFEPAIGLLCGIPGWGRTTAEVFIAEIGGDMSVFPTAQQLASWAGVAPGTHES
ncbi:MAG: transposase, partial [Actinomycetota bacterium]